ncbi:MAG: hypothetical protein ACYDC1_24680 [Limisphaerales bacterium]
MIPDYFTRTVALRHLRFSLGQTAASIGVVALSVTVIIFLGALIGGLQIRLLGSVTGAISHVVVKPPERLPVAAWEVPALQRSNVLYVGSTVKLPQRRRKIEDWVPWGCNSRFRIPRAVRDVAAICKWVSCWTRR